MEPLVTCFRWEQNWRVVCCCRDTKPRSQRWTGHRPETAVCVSPAAWTDISGCRRCCPNSRVFVNCRQEVPDSDSSQWCTCTYDCSCFPQSQKVLHKKKEWEIKWTCFQMHFHVLLYDVVCWVLFSFHELTSILKWMNSAKLPSACQ